MYKKKLVNLFSEEKFLSDLFKLKNENEVKEFFDTKGVELTIEQLEEICDIIEACTGYNGAIPDDQLDKAVGGISSEAIRELLKKNIEQINKIISDIKISPKSFWRREN